MKNICAESFALFQCADPVFQLFCISRSDDGKCLSLSSDKLYHISDESHVYQKTDVAVTQVMDPDLFNSGLLCASVHFVMQIVHGYGKDPVVLLDLIKTFPIILHLITEGSRHFHRTHTFLRLRRGDQILAADALVGLVDPNGPFFKVEIPGRQGQELAFADAASVQHLESIVRHRHPHPGPDGRASPPQTRQKTEE